MEDEAEKERGSASFLLTPSRIVCVRRGTRPDIPDAVGKNLEGYSWVIVLT
jgi:hypothetical protein